MPTDRLPMMEWATWWDKTIDRWRGEGLPVDLDNAGIKRYFGLDVDHQLWMASIYEWRSPYEEKWIENELDYDQIRSCLYHRKRPYDPEHLDRLGQDDATFWITLNGFFWWPRVLFGIEGHLYAFYDHPKLMHRINEDLTEHMLWLLETLTFQPDFMTFAEDMSYNHGPMLSKDLFDEFLAPYYRRVVPELKKRGIVPLIDSDGDVEPMVPWLQEVGIEGILPLERRAGVDVARMRQNHPDWTMVGAFDKTVMHLGDEAIREEFERLLPTMRNGRFIPSVDHQTPPEVSMADYRRYLAHLCEYVEKAVA